MTEHHLLVPVSGLIHVMHAERHLDVRDTLTTFGAAGKFMTLHVLGEEEHLGNVSWFHDDLGPVNQRARVALTMIADIHMVVTGPVIFSYLDVDLTNDIVVELSRPREGS